MDKISINKIAAEIAKGIMEYSQDVVDRIEVSSEEIAKKAVKTLKATSPEDSGNYAKSWRYTVKKVKRHSRKQLGQINKYTIHNKDHYRLAHLLEYGHAKRDGGRVQAKPHIGPVEQDVINEFMAEVESAIRNGGKK